MHRVRCLSGRLALQLVQVLRQGVSERLLQHNAGVLTEQEELSCGKGIVVGIASAVSSLGEKRHILQPELILTASPRRSVHKLREGVLC